MAALTVEGHPRVSVLTVNYRSTDRLRLCLRALERSTAAAQTEVIVVDNASADFDEDALRREFPTVIFLPQLANLTYTQGNNIAAAVARGEYILLLNPDTTIAPDAIERGVAVLDSAPHVAAITGRLVNPDGSLQRYYRRLPTLLDLPAFLLPRLFGWTPRGRRYLMQDEAFDRPVDVGQPPGAFIMIRRSIAPEPLLDPRYLNYCSDVALCRDLWARGQMQYRPEIECGHERGGAGVRTANISERLRLHHDLTWGARLYFRQGATPTGRLYLEAWLAAFWILRVAQVVCRSTRHAREALRVAGRALGGTPPTY